MLDGNLNVRIDVNVLLYPEFKKKIMERKEKVREGRRREEEETWER